MTLTDLLLSRFTTGVLATSLGIVLLVWAGYVDTTGGRLQTLLGVAAAGLCAMFLLRLVARFRRLSQPAALPARQSLRWEESGRFDPVDAGPRRGTGYIAYTDSFSATGTVHHYLAALSEEETRIVFCGAACAYLRERMGLPPSQILSDEGERRPPTTPVSAVSTLGWLAAIHRDYPDNAPPDSSFVQRALHHAAEEYADGRSLALQRAWRSLDTELLRAGLDPDSRRLRLDAQRELRDLDVKASTTLLRWGADQGRQLGRLHGPAPERSWA
ncbi:hypothetical protein [Sphingosinicella sp. BN140058]|uniref:hypothetical protein n=1 Tax=Sphingosinicella sp. BN140058 TaxID=1892855 RepID=UPI001011EE88|nr:hypothetical protein [Sphingosinicella sp. BN140058]QAY78929.1 hypothetical protein ETR14_22100 [Sphingosinicella sp. BN140058]